MLRNLLTRISSRRGVTETGHPQEDDSDKGEVISLWLCDRDIARLRRQIEKTWPNLEIQAAAVLHLCIGLDAAEAGLAQAVHNQRWRADRAGSSSTSSADATVPRPSRRGATKRDADLIAEVEQFRERHGRDPSTTEVKSMRPTLSIRSARRYRRLGRRSQERLTIVS